MNISFEFVASIPLSHPGDCSLLGVSADLTIYVEEIYGEDGWIAQHALKPDKTIVASTDENAGVNRNFRTLTLPRDLVCSQSCKYTKALNFSGARHRGLRESERIAETVRPLTLQTKLALIERLHLKIPPSMLLGIAESYVLAEAVMLPPDIFMVCRRLRLAFALPQVQYDNNYQPYDYDTLVVYGAHDYNPHIDDEIPPEHALAGLPGTSLRRPMDCIIRDHYLFIADGGINDQVSAVHIWRTAKIENSR